jgi:C-terminal processing protease CtpA/Prc
MRNSNYRMKFSIRHFAIVAALLANGFAATNGAAQFLNTSGPQQDMAIDVKTRAAVIEGAIKALNENYIFPETAKKMEQAVRERMKRKEYDKITGAENLARTLTAHLQEVSRDKHLRIRYSQEILPDFSREQQASPDERERQRAFAGARNFGFEKVERLDGNIGYFDLRGFMDAEMAGETAAAAMSFLANTDALIIDLRRNGGGQPEMVALLSSYLFDKPTHLNDIYSRFDNRTQEYWTREPVAGKRYGESKPVYVLTSNRTFSGAEEFAYNLKNLKRATIIGETTGGGAHPVRPHRLTDHFMIGVPFARAINPITKTNWEGTGVKPDIETPAAQALKTAHLLALKNILAKTVDAQRAIELKNVIESTQKELDELNSPATQQTTAAVEEGLKLPNTPAGNTLEKFIRAFNTGDLATLRRFHEEHGGDPENAQQDIGFYERSGGLKLHSVISSSAHAIEVLVQSKKDESWLSFAISVAALPPNGITDIRVRPTAAPKP